MEDQSPSCSSFLAYQTVRISLKIVIFTSKYSIKVLKGTDIKFSNSMKR